MAKKIIKKRVVKKSTKAAGPKAVKPAVKQPEAPAYKKPQYSIRYNDYKKRVIINVNVHNIPDKFLTIDVREDRFHFDTLKFSKKLLLDEPYPNNVRVLPDEAYTKYNGGLLQIRIPVEGEKAADPWEEKKDILEHPVKPRVANVRVNKPKEENVTPAMTAEAEKQRLLTAADAAIRKEYSNRAVLTEREQERETKLMETLTAKQKRLEEKARKREELKQAARERQKSKK